MSSATGSARPAAKGGAVSPFALRASHDPRPTFSRRTACDSLLVSAAAGVALLDGRMASASRGRHSSCRLEEHIQGRHPGLIAAVCSEACRSVVCAWVLNQAVWKRREPAPLPALAREGWRRRESNPRPVMIQNKRLRAYSVDLSLVDAPPADRVRHPPARNFFSPTRTRRWSGASRIWRPIGRPFRLGPSLGVA